MTVTIRANQRKPLGEEQLLLDALHHVFNTLRDHGLEFCVLRNRDRIPHALLEGSDVDLAISAGRPSDMIRRFLKDVRPALVIEHHEFFQIFVRCGAYFLKIDTWWNDQQFLGATYIRNQEIIDQSSVQDGIPTASPLHQALVSWFNSLLWAGWTKDRYLPLIQSVIASEPEAFRRYLIEAVGPRLADALWTTAQEGNLSRFARQCRRSLWTHSLKKRPLQTILGLLQHYHREVMLWLRPPGVQIALLGPDGAGKSSVAAALANLPPGRLPTIFRIQHIYRPLLPSPRTLRRLYSRRPSQRHGIVTNPHGEQPRSLILSVVKAMYYLVDSWLSHIAVNRYLVSRNQSIVSDRNLIELAVDPLRYRFGGPHALAQAVSRVAPRPDVVIILDAPAGVLQARKQEVPVEESERQRVAYRALGERLSNGYIIDASRPLPEVVEEVREIIIKVMASRTARRFGLEIAP